MYSAPITKKKNIGALHYYMLSNYIKALNVKRLHGHRVKVSDIPAAGDRSDLWERQLKKHLFLIVDDIDSSPVHSNDHIVLRQTRSRKLIRLVEAREQQRPLVARVVDDVLLHLQRCNATPYEIALCERLLDLVGPVRHGLRGGQAVVGDVGGNQRLKTIVHHLRAKVDVVLLCGNHCQVVILQDTVHQLCTVQTD